GETRLTHAQSAMRIAYLECFSGISGDMFLGALVDAGVSPSLLEDTVAALDVGARLEISRVLRSGISASKVDVWVGDRKEGPAGKDHHEHGHGDHHHFHGGHEHSHEHHDHAQEHHHTHGRHLSEI